MSVNPPKTSSGLPVLRTVLYVLAALILVVGLITSLSLMTSADMIVANFLMPLQFFGSDAISNMLSPLLSGFLINLGVVTLIVTLILSGLLYAVGRLIGHIALLETRLARLEARV